MSAASMKSRVQKKMQEALHSYHQAGNKGAMPAVKGKTTAHLPAGPKAAKPAATPAQPGMAPAAVTKPKSPLEMLLDGAVRDKYGEADDKLAGAVSDEKARGAIGGTIDQVWQQYQGQMQGHQADAQAALASAAGAQAQVAQGAQQQIGTLGGQQAVEQAKQVQTQGATGQVDAAALNDQLRHTLGAYATVAGSELAGHAANAMNHLTDQAAIGSRQQVADHQHSGKVLGDLADEGVSLAKDKGALRETKRQELVDKAQTLKLAYEQLNQKAAAADQQATIDQLTLDSKNTNAALDRQVKVGLAADANQLGYDKLNQTIKTQTASQRLAQRTQAHKEVDDAIKNGISASKGTGAGKLKPGETTSNGVKFTPQQKADYESKRAKIITLGRQFSKLLHSGQDQFLDGDGNPSTAKVTAYLKKSGTNYSVEEMNMARDMAVYGHLSKANLGTARGYFPNGLVPKPLGG